MTYIKVAFYIVAAFGYTSAGIKIAPMLEGMDAIVTGCAFVLAVIAMVEQALGEFK